MNPMNPWPEDPVFEHKYYPPVVAVLPPPVLAAAQRVSPWVWKEPYQLGRGTLHYSSGTAHREQLLALAARCDQRARDCRILADFLKGTGRVSVVPS